MRRQLGLVCLAGALTLLTGTRTAHAGGDWNDDGIAWRPYEAGLEEAKKAKKPICLIFFTEWCPHCQNYSKVFHDPEVVEESKRFVMIRLDNGKNREIGKKYAPDGGYIPRTFFLSSDGKIDPEIHTPRSSYKYFYDEHDPKSVLAGMRAAVAKLK